MGVVGGSRPAAVASEVTRLAFGAFFRLVGLLSWLDTMKLAGNAYYYSFGSDFDCVLTNMLESRGWCLFFIFVGLPLCWVAAEERGDRWVGLGGGTRAELR